MKINKNYESQTDSRSFFEIHCESKEIERIRAFIVAKIIYCEKGENLLKRSDDIFHCFAKVVHGNYIFSLCLNQQFKEKPQNDHFYDSQFLEFSLKKSSL